MKRVLYVFAKLLEPDIEWLVRHGRRIALKQNETLIREGAPVDALYVLLDGALSVSVRGEQLATLSYGEVVGELSFLDSRAPTATVMATAPSAVLAVAKEDLKRKLIEDDGFAARFYHALGFFLASRLRTTIGRFGVGAVTRDQADPDELDPALMDEVELAAARFDWMLKQLPEA
jgi:CRP/FNR family transcriptional regulator, cyclic AMP receptor protein